MILEKVIPKLKIQKDYQDFVDTFIDRTLSEFGDKVHSLYMCGSVPLGTARPFSSDADFTLVCANPANIDYDRLSTVRQEVLNEYPFVTKIDTTVCSIENVLNRPNDWGFWVKVICICVHGDDLGERVPPIVVSPKFIVELNADTPMEFARARRSLAESGDNEEARQRSTKGCSKRLMRALYSLVMDDTGVWENSMLKMKEAISTYCAIDSALVEYLYASYLHSDVPTEEFLIRADQAYRYFEDALRTMTERPDPASFQ